MHYHFKLYKEQVGYWAQCIELSGCQSQGNTLEELKINLEEALSLYLNEPGSSNVIFPLPDQTIAGNDPL